MAHLLKLVSRLSSWLRARVTTLDESMPVRRIEVRKHAHPYGGKNFPEGSDARGRYLQSRIQCLNQELVDLQLEYSANYTEHQEPPIVLPGKAHGVHSIDGYGIVTTTVPKRGPKGVQSKRIDGTMTDVCILAVAPQDFYKMRHLKPVEL